jgi:hypothetical protein
MRCNLGQTVPARAGDSTANKNFLYEVCMLSNLNKDILRRLLNRATTLFACIYVDIVRPI